MSGQISVVTSTWQPVLSLILGALVVMGSPGPSTISATAVGAAFGLRRSLPYVTGLIVGTTVVLLAVALGAIALILVLPQGARALTIISIVYILYLAVRIATARPLSASMHERPAPGFGGGLVLALANPKAYLAIAAVYSGTSLFVDQAIDALAKMALLATMIVAIHLSWLCAGTYLSRALQNPRTSRIANFCLAALLVLTTIGPHLL
jgi:threonine/homoserine/homoserine lactone efflux protein